MLAPDDAQHRCSNCIRLKKECNFFPVDQQPQVERRPRTGSKLEHNGETSTSSSSSPAVGGGSSLDPIDHFHHYPPLPLSTPDYPSATASLNGDLVSPVGRGSQTVSYPHISSEVQLIRMQAQPVIEGLSFRINMNDPIGIRPSLTMARYLQDIQPQKTPLTHTGSSPSPRSRPDFRRNTPNRRVRCHNKLAMPGPPSPRSRRRETNMDGQCMLGQCHSVTLMMCR